jgi:hypothetical protein
LIVFDKDSPFYDTSSDKRELPENASKQEQLPDGSRQGQNNYDRIGYVGPVSTKGDSSLCLYSIRPRYKAESATWSVEEIGGKSNERARSGERRTRKSFPTLSEGEVDEGISVSLFPCLRRHVDSCIVPTCKGHTKD